VNDQFVATGKGVSQFPNQLIRRRTKGRMAIQEERTGRAQFQYLAQEDRDGREFLVGGDLEFGALENGGTADGDEMDLDLDRIIRGGIEGHCDGVHAGDSGAPNGVASEENGAFLYPVFNFFRKNAFPDPVPFDRIRFPSWTHFSRHTGKFVVVVVRRGGT
jgi:hypothetical protein